MSHQLRIRVACPDCGVVTVGVADVTLRLCADDNRWSCCFRCPVCRRASTHGVAGHVIANLLSDFGMEVQRWHRPAELTEPRPWGPAFSLDDLLDFHLLLQRTDQPAAELEELEKLETRSG